MTAPALMKYLSEVLIIAGVNDGIRCNDGSWFTAEIAAGTYFISGDDSATDLLKAIKTAMDAVGTGTWTIALTSANKVQFTCDTAASDPWAIDMDNAATTFDFEILGAADKSAAFGAADSVADTLDYQHKNGWYSTQPIESDSDETKEADISQSRSKGGQIYTVKSGTDYTVRRLSHAYEPYRKTFPDASYVNQSWIEFWATCNSGEQVRYYEDVDVDSWDTYVFKDETLKEARPNRFSFGVQVYNWFVDLYEYV